MTVMQLTLDGREVPHATVLAELRGFSDLQRSVLRQMALHGQIRTSEAGRFVHGGRGHCGHHVTYPAHPHGLCCCRYGPTDGLALLHRLRRRGAVERVGHGLWVVVRRDD